MKFNRAIIYKAPFDSSYKNVVDYHSYTKELNNALVEDTIDSDGIKYARDRYFGNLPNRTVYFVSSSPRSVKVIGNKFVTSIALDYDTACEYNYIRFTLWDREEGNINDYFCFITSIESSNESGTPSVVVSGEIDYWTTYVDTMTLNTPNQLEQYAHTNPNLINAKSDKRLPQDFIYRNTYDYLFDDAILFLVVDMDQDHFPFSSAWNSFSGTVGRWVRLYVPILALKRENDNITARAIIGAWQSDNNYVDSSSYIAKNGWLKALDNQYIYGAKLSIFTPIGVMKASQYTHIYDNHVYFTANTLVTNTFETYVYGSQTDKFGGVVDNAGAFIFAASFTNILGLNNKSDTVSIDGTWHGNTNINAQHSFVNENKQYQYPYNLKTLIYKGKSYNVTPEPTYPARVEITFRLFDNIEMKITNTNNIADTLYINLGDNDAVATSVDTYQAYKQTQQTADQATTAATVSTAALTALATALLAPTAGATAPLVIAGAIGGAATTAAAKISSYAGKQVAQKNAPDTINSPSNNSLDLFSSVFPRIRTSILRSDDEEIIDALWTRQGYPVFASNPFVMHRFWYDYKQLTNATFPAITNVLGRKTLENVFNNGTTIWHYNLVNDLSRNVSIGDYTKNNPSNQNCREVT